MTLSQKDIAYLKENYPDTIPIEVAAEFISRYSPKSKSLQPQSLRVAIQRGTCPFAWAIPPKAGEVWRYRIETHKFIEYFSAA